MELYVDLLSQPCRSVYMFAKALKIPFELKLVDLSAGQQYSDDFGKLSVVKKVPVLKDGDFVLTESTAILMYLAKKHSVADHWYPADLQQRARVHEYLSWQHLNLRSHASKVFLLMVFYPVIVDGKAPKEKMDAALEELKQSLDLLEQKFLQDKPFIIGNEVSIADLVALVEISQPTGAGVKVFEGRPKLEAWRDRVKKEVGEKLVDEANESLMKASSMPEKMKDNPNLDMLKARFRKMFQ
ncbi:glutathione S-transferase theta-1a isoform X1 [Stegastes partitus]|uniref:glutathione transferase n=1 Tax=Stegastes partitus TaxID=144197 RepID=A0A9Y4K6K6_9TELE|nr:PREDICTED: glutathione S-transferase theta-1-like isoform X1 [Stegastes partitus]